MLNLCSRVKSIGFPVIVLHVYQHQSSHAYPPCELKYTFPKYLSQMSGSITNLLASPLPLSVRIGLECTFKPAAFFPIIFKITQFRNVFGKKHLGRRYSLFYHFPSTNALQSCQKIFEIIWTCIDLEMWIARCGLPGLKTNIMQLEKILSISMGTVG